MDIISKHSKHRENLSECEIQSVGTHTMHESRIFISSPLSFNRELTLRF